MFGIFSYSERPGLLSSKLLAYNDMKKAVCYMKTIRIAKNRSETPLMVDYVLIKRYHSKKRIKSH